MHSMCALALFPARAGMNRSLTTITGRLVTVPRTRGDEPVRHLVDRLSRNCSPHARG